MSKAVGIAFKLTALVLLLGILGVSIGVLIVTLNVRDDVEATSVAPTTFSTLPPPTTTAPVNPDDKNIRTGDVIDQTKEPKRFAKFQTISNLYEKWMDLTVDPCNDFYHYVCGKGQKNKEESPFTISQRADNIVEAAMWQHDDAYWKKMPVPVQQVKWFRDKCSTDSSYTTADQETKIKEFLQQFIDHSPSPVPWFTPKEAFVMDKTAFSKMLGYGKGQFSVYAFLTTFASVDFKQPDDAYTFYVDQPLPLYKASAYSSAITKNQMVADITATINEAARILGGITLDKAEVKKMATSVRDFDEVISTSMQADPIARRQVERNYNKFNLADLNIRYTQFDWVPYIQGALTLLGNQITVDDKQTIIIMEPEILDTLNNHIANGDRVTVANYVFLRAFAQILGSVPAPPVAPPTPARALDAYRPVLNRDPRTLTGTLLRKMPEMPQTKAMTASICAKLVEGLLPWPTTRLYVDADIPDAGARQTLKENVAEIAKWIFFGFRSQLDQLNWMDKDSKKGAFDKLDNIQLNVAYPDFVTNDANLTVYYKDLDYTETDNFMNIVLKMTHYFNMQQLLPFIQPTPRDRGDFGSFIGITNAWYQPQMNSITFPEGILQEPFYSPDYPLATIFGGLGAISGHELTHGFDDQGVQWDGIGALKAWMSPTSQTSFNEMAQCVIDEYSNFCPFEDVCVNGNNTQGENIADNGGIQAAYKALKAYESLNGADPRLPDFGSSFTSDQLFFLTFAQTWCDAELDIVDAKIDIATDVHSPAMYRVLGTIQNFPAFKNAFNCPANTPYTPDQHCNVWTSKPF